MTVVNMIDEIAEWLEKNVCVNVKLKPRSFEKDTEQFKYELVHPAVFPFFVPTFDHKPPHIKATSPAICVQVVEGNDLVMTHSRSLSLNLTFSAWDPGLHGPDIFTPTDDVSPSFGRVYERGEEGTFRLTHTGWRDVWNFVDVALRVIEQSRALAGYPLDPSVPIKFGAYDEDATVADYYPFWHAWIELTVKSDVVTSATDSATYDNLLY